MSFNRKVQFSMLQRVSVHQEKLSWFSKQSHFIWFTIMQGHLDTIWTWQFSGQLLSNHAVSSMSLNGHW